MDNLFVVPQKAEIKDGDKYLILRRSYDSKTYGGHWDFPGGRINHKEDVKEALKREVLEETKLKVDVGKSLFVFSEDVGVANAYFVVFECTLLSGEIELSSEHTEYKWATKEEILKEDRVEEFLLSFLRSR
ncbi:MAG: NUDIX domain-containing protein [Candidatus Altiarchaeota archaeon]|nr:NUDIX domain-containing protein [Candidatus Altiarchaeota archaeon]